jgi:hypothetical protein
MLLPVLFVLHAVCVAAGMLLLYCIVAFHISRRSAAQRGFELVERANEGHVPKTALRGLLARPGDGLS